MCMSFGTYRRDVHPLETDTKGRLFSVDVSIDWPVSEIGRPKYLIHGRQFS